MPTLKYICSMTHNKQRSLQLLLLICFASTMVSNPLHAGMALLPRCPFNSCYAKMAVCLPYLALDKAAAPYST